MIYTCSYDNFKTDLYRSISISGDKGKKIGYDKNYYKDLAPKKEFWETWHNNMNILTEEENNRYYIEEYYKQVLSKLDPEKIFSELNNSFLLCYEDSLDFCHRHIVAAWLEIFLNIEVNEVIVEGLYIKKVERPDYIKPMLEEIIKNNINMRGFKSLRAVYLFDKSEELEQYADLMEKKYNKSYDRYRQAACFMRCEADMADDLYLETQKRLTKTRGNNE